MKKPKVYVHRLEDWYSLYMDANNEKLLRSFCDVVTESDRMEPMSEEELVDRMKDCEAILSLNGIGTDEITLDVLRRVGTIRLIVISHWWNQFERLDLKSLGIRVVEGSNANTVAVAEWVLTAALMGIRRLTDFDAKMKEGSLWCEPRRCGGMLYGKRVGLVGLGRIGRYSARLFQMMGAKVQAYDKYFSPDEARLLGIELVTLDEALQNSDIISLHLPVTEETRGMLKKEHFEKIPDGAVFINSARAALYEEKALIEELKKKRFFAYLDVFSQEPLPVDHPLRSLENVLITPHIAGDNPDMFRLCGKQAIDTLRDYFSGKEVVDKKYYLGIGEKN